MITVSQATDLELVRGLLRGYAEQAGLDVTPQQFEEELAALDQVYDEILVAKVGERVGGCVALQKIDDHTCAVKRLYVRPPLRKNGAGSALMQCVIESGRMRGYSKMSFEAQPKMTDAMRLCEKLGFRRSDAPAEGPQSLELQLAGDGLPTDLAMDDMGSFLSDDE